MDVLLNTQIKRFLRKGTWKYVSGSTNLSTGVYRTDLNVTGQGYFLYTFARGASASNEEYVGIRITVDGGTTYELSGLTNGVATKAGGALFTFVLQFNTSLKVEVTNLSATLQTVSTSIAYVLTT